VAESLGYQFVDKDRILTEMKAAGEKWGHLAEEMDEASPSLWERYDWQYRGLIALMESYLLSYALQDRVVLIGRGSNFLLEDLPHVLRVRIFAPLEKRIERAMVKDSVDRKTAEWLIKKVDKDRASYIYVNYGKHWEDQKYYDMVFNTGVQSYQEVAKILVDALRLKEPLATTQVVEKLACRSLAARIKAQIYTESKLVIPTLEILCQEGTIVLKGVVHSPREYQFIGEIAGNLAQDFPVENELHYRK
jgi:cytidylate kinase